ncbi:MAG: hypothetical protein EGQ78_07235 [Clostridiales bacterium]|nr:hypothetical protein [Clostridiales bacterium]
MKKMFKKSIAMLIAVLMVISAMPFTAITAFAATSTLSNSGFTIVYNNSNGNSNTRWENNQFNIVNDQKYDNTSVGILKYDISALKGKTIDSATLNFSVDSFYGDGNGLVFYYSNRLSNVTLNNGSTGDSELSYGEGTTANTGAASRYGFDVNNVLTTVSRGDTASKSVDIANAVKSVLNSGSTEFYVFIMQQTAGGDGGNQIDGATAAWTDTKIKPANVTINYSTSVKTSYTFDEMVTALNNFTPYSPNAHGSFSNDTTYTNYSDHYKGLVYAEDVRDYSATGSVQLSSGGTGSNTNYANLYFPTSVALYTGSNEITVPIMISAATARSGFYDCYFRPHAGVISGTGLSLVNSTWNGKTEVDGGWDNCYANGNQTSNLPGLDFMKTINLTSYYLSTTVATSPTNSNIDTGYGRRAQIFANKVKVSPSFNDNAKSTVLTYNPTITYYVTPKDNGINTGKYITFNSTDAVTVVNYKPYLDKINTAKQDIRNMNNIGSAHYEAESLKAYVDACVKLINIDPSDNSKYAYSSAAPNAAQTLANDINSALTAYDNAKAGLKFNYTFIDVNNNSTVVAAKDEAEALANKPNNTPATKKTPANDHVNHKWTEYTWPTTATNYTFTEVGDEKLEAHDTLDGGKCSKCGYIALDLDAYNAANDVVLSILSNENKYTSESFAKYKAAIKSHINKQNEFTSQDEVNAATYAIVSAEVLLQKKSVTIKFVVEKEDGTYTTDTKNPDWGESVNLDTQSNYVSKWTIDVNGVTSKIDSNATAIDHVATENATIKAYVSNDETETVKYSKVTFLGKNSAVVGIKYVVAGTTVDTNTLLTAPAIPFYEDGQWDKAEIKADGSDITVRATYVPKAGDEKKCGIHFKGDTKYYNYDSYVYLFNADKSKKYAMYADADETQLITYFDGVDFYAPRRDNLYIKEVPDTSAMTATIGFTGFYKQDTTSSFNVKFWLPEGATLVETGVDLVAKFPNGTVKSAHDRATKFSERNEYTYSAKFSDSQKTIEFKPYLTYEKNGETTTVYGASQTVEY